MLEFEKNVLNVIKKEKLIVNKDKIVLGVSGGPDSMAMLSVLYEIKKSKIIDFDLCVAHVNHGIRESAQIDEEYVKDFCKQRNISVYVLKTNVIDIAKKKKKGIEETGRKVRYNFFEEILKKTSSNKIAIAHNKKDNAETIIMNLFRGSGLSGLSGISIMSGNCIRPLLNENREDIEKYLKDKNIIPRIDETNFDNNYTRNKIRNVVLPYIEENFNPNIIETLARLSLIINEENEYLNKQTIKHYNEIKIEEKNCTIILKLKEFNLLDKVIQKRIILHAIFNLFGTTNNIEKIHIDDIIKLCNNNIGNKYLTPNKDTKIEIKNKRIYITRLN